MKAIEKFKQIATKSSNGDFTFIKDEVAYWLPKNSTEIYMIDKKRNLFKTLSPADVMKKNKKQKNV
jgi:hypothetical protein